MKPDVFATYTSAEVVEHYDRTRELFASERALFGEYLRRGMSILDVGVGAGRTAPHVSALASRYVGIDYSEAMVKRCQDNFPDLSFQTMDATDMAAFPDRSFDAVVFSFNGIDTIPTAGGRRRCLGECARVLKPGGVFLFSVHNARYVFYLPVVSGAGPFRSIWRVVYALGHTLMLLAFRLPSPALWRGRGFVWDPPSYGSPRIYVSTPSNVAAEVAAHGLRVVAVVPGPKPRVRFAPATPWYEYACTKQAGVGTPA